MSKSGVNQEFIGFNPFQYQLYICYGRIPFPIVHVNQNRRYESYLNQLSGGPLPRTFPFLWKKIRKYDLPLSYCPYIWTRMSKQYGIIPNPTPIAQCRSMRHFRHSKSSHSQACCAVLLTTGIFQGIISSGTKIISHQKSSYKTNSPLYHRIFHGKPPAQNSLEIRCFLINWIFISPNPCKAGNIFFLNNNILL